MPARFLCFRLMRQFETIHWGVCFEHKISWSILTKTVVKFNTLREFTADYKMC